MKVLTFGWELPPHNAGGLGIACMGLSRALADEGVEVTFVLPRRMEAKAPGCRLIFADNRPPEEYDNDIVNRINTAYMSAEDYERMCALFPELRDIRGSLYDQTRAYAMHARRIAEEEDFDIIHAHDWFSFLAGMAAKEVSGKPLVLHQHLAAVEQTALQGEPDSNIFAIEQAGYRAADRIIAVSEYEKQILVRYYNVPHDKIDVVHNGIDSDDMTVRQSSENLVHALKDQGKDIVLFVGRITIMKGPEYFLRAAKKVLEYRPNTVFVISGAGDMERQVIQEAAYHGIGDKVLFVGFLRGDALAAMYNMADLLVMPSVTEPFGIVPLEAARNGIPVIVSKQSGVAEVLQHALKVDFWDTDAMANKIIAVLNHESLQTSLREGSMREVMGMVWRNAAQKCKNVFSNLLKLVTIQTQ